MIVTPEYNHSYPASLKHAIDQGYVEWMAKPVGFVSYGGTTGGVRAIEHLRHVFAELHAATIRDYICFISARRQFDADGNPIDREGPRNAAKIMLDRLAWWADALRNGARSRGPMSKARGDKSVVEWRRALWWSGARLPGPTRSSAGSPS